MPRVSFDSATYVVAEGSTVDVTVYLDAEKPITVTIPLSTTNLGGALASDYSGVPGNVSFVNSGTDEQTFSVTATDDSEDDDDESVVLGFGALPEEVSAGNVITATLRITDDDVPQVEVSFDREVYTVAEGSGGTTVTVELSADPERMVTIPISVTHNNGATTGDYTGVPLSVTFNSGEQTKRFTPDRDRRYRGRRRREPDAAFRYVARARIRGQPDHGDGHH